MADMICWHASNGLLPMINGCAINVQPGCCWLSILRLANIEIETSSVDDDNGNFDDVGCIDDDDDDGVIDTQCVGCTVIIIIIISDIHSAIIVDNDINELRWEAEMYAEEKEDNNGVNDDNDDDDDGHNTISVSIQLSVLKE